MYEANYGLRQIFMDGRPLPEPNDVEPWWYGYSVGHWDGDTLVVETTGFRDDVWLDVEGSPLTNTGKMIERFTPPRFRPPEDRCYGRRSQGLHPPVDRDGQSAAHAGHEPD